LDTIVPVPPPPVLDTARLLAYAYVSDGIEFTDRIYLVVDGEKLGRVPCLAITLNYCVPGDILLCFCDNEWNVLGVSAHASIAEAKAYAERGYKGASGKWVDDPYTDEQVAGYLRVEYGVDPTTEWWKTLCSFCGKDVLELRAVASRNAVICEECIVAFHADLTRGSGTAQSVGADGDP
jgi:hypothetical protein